MTVPARSASARRRRRGLTMHTILARSRATASGREWARRDHHRAGVALMRPALAWSAPRRSIDDPPREPHRGKPVGRRAGEAPGLALRDESGELLALAVREVAPAPATVSQERDQAAPLGRGEARDVPARQHADLRDREQLEEGQPPQTGDVREQAGGGAGT